MLFFSYFDNLKYFITCVLIIPCIYNGYLLFQVIFYCFLCIWCYTMLNEQSEPEIVFYMETKALLHQFLWSPDCSFTFVAFTYYYCLCVCVCVCGCVCVCVVFALDYMLLICTRIMVPLITPCALQWSQKLLHLDSGSIGYLI